MSSCAAGSCHLRGERGALLAWTTTAASQQITMEIHISDWTHKFQNKTGLDAKANSELYKSERVCSVYTVDRISLEIRSTPDNNVRQVRSRQCHHYGET